MLKNPPPLSEAKDLSELYEATPPKKMVHIIIQTPTPGEFIFRTLLLADGFTNNYAVNHFGLKIRSSVTHPVSYVNPTEKLLTSTH